MVLRFTRTLRPLYIAMRNESDASAPRRYRQRFHGRARSSSHII